MRVFSMVGILGIATTAGAAPPTAYVFRELKSNAVWQRSDAPDRLRTYTVGIDGERVTVDVVSATQDGKAWREEPPISITGTAVTDKGLTTLALGGSTYTCQKKRVTVAAATARRVTHAPGEGVLGGKWKGKTSRVNALVCEGATVAAPLPQVLVLAPKPVEHVIADDDCCKTPGDALRAVPADRSVAPLTR